MGLINIAQATSNSAFYKDAQSAADPSDMATTADRTNLSILPPAEVITSGVSRLGNTL